MDRKAKLDTLALILGQTRTNANVSQKYMAQKLGKSVGTIQNWENGIGNPNIIEFLDWFNILGTNPLKYFLEFMYPDLYLGLSGKSSSDDVRKALINYLQNVAPDSEIRKIAFCIFANTTSSWHAQLDMITAHNHTCLKSRVNIAQNIVNNYEMELERDELIAKDHVMPDMENLLSAIEYGKKSAKENKSGYSNIKD